jgi:transposase
MSKQYVGIDLHRRRSVIVRMTPEGEVIEEVRIDNDPVALALEIAKAGSNPEVVLEATYGWYWAADVLKDAGAGVHLAHPLGINGFKNRRVKRDGIDAFDLADLLRMNRLPEGWIAPDDIRALRELVRYRSKLVALATGAKSQIHAVLAKHGVNVPVTDLFGVDGNRLLDELCFDRAYALRIASLRELIAAYDGEVFALNKEIKAMVADNRGYHALQAIPGIGPVIAAILVAEIGDVSRFSTAAKLASWAGVTPRHRESDNVVHRGHITKQGSRLVRWAITEAVVKLRSDTKQHRDYARISARRGRRVARVAVARKLLTLVYYGLRDGEVRCLSSLKEAA